MTSSMNSIKRVEEPDVSDASNAYSILPDCLYDLFNRNEFEDRVYVQIIVFASICPSDRFRLQMDG